MSARNTAHRLSPYQTYVRPQVRSLHVKKLKDPGNRAHIFNPNTQLKSKGRWSSVSSMWGKFIEKCQASYMVRFLSQERNSLLTHLVICRNKQKRHEPTFFIPRKVQIKPTMNHCHILIRLANIKTFLEIACFDDIVWNPFSLLFQIQKDTSYGKQCGSS